MKIEQIKKALECCEDSEKCDVCPYYGSIHCQEILIKDAIGFINRQQTEIERLKTENGHFERNMKSVLEIEKENIRKETAKEILNELIDSSNKITFFDCRMALGLDKLAKQFGLEIKE